MKFKKTFSLMMATLLLVAMAMGASAAMWFGPEFGPSFNAPIDVKVSQPFGNTTINNMKARAGFASGAMIGYDFVNYGAGAYCWPDWMKYFGVAMGVSYNPLYFSPQNRTTNTGFNVATPTVDGSNIALSFLFMGKYPFLVDKEYPGGRLAPYVGVGPGLVFTTMDFNQLGGSNRTSTNVGLVAEAGVRYMITPAFSADLAYRYRYNVPTFSFANNSVTLTGNQNTSQVLARLAYHW